MSLREATKDYHHAAERHPVGAAMADGTISAQWWADWLGALFIVHSAIDPGLPEALRRTQQIAEDIAAVGVQPRLNQAALRYALHMTDADREAAAYVFTGAHLMGGAITARQVSDRLPTQHLQWEDRQDAVRCWKPLRDRDDLAEPACRAFAAVLAICEDVIAASSQHTTRTIK